MCITTNYNNYVNVNKERSEENSKILLKFIKEWIVDQFKSFLDQSDHDHLYHTPVHPAYQDFINPERSGQKKILAWELLVLLTIPWLVFVLILWKHKKVTFGPLKSKEKISTNQQSTQYTEHIQFPRQSG